ncbi:methyltransferase family protein [Chloroflexota bacterium]
MSLVPEFDIGLWNAWIPILYYPLHPLIMLLIDKLVGTGGMFQKMGSAPYTKSEKRAFIFANALTILLLIYSIFLPLKLWTAWFYVGAAIYLSGLVMFKIAIVNIATTPLGQPFTKGLYRYSRHPMNLFGTVALIGIGIAAASWLFLLASIVSMILFGITVTGEERGCCELYGDYYREYMKQTPRWIGVPKEV